MSILQAALDLAARGVPVFPCLETKAPAVAGGFTSASTDAATIRTMFTNPAAGLIGVPTGAASGLDVLDLDPRKGSEEWWDANERHIPVTLVHETRSGGKHLVFRHCPGLRSSASRIAPGVDVRADGGYVVWWPASGLPVWMEEDPAPWPSWVLAGLDTRPAPAEPRDLAHLAPPSADAVVDLLSRLPNPLSAGRDTYARVMLAARGCEQALDQDDGGAIGDAAVAWAERWEGGSECDEREKWDSDWSHRDALKAGWTTLLRVAHDLIPGFRDPTAGTEFEPLPVVPAEDAGPWQSMLQVNDDGNARANLLNACTALRCAPAWRGVFRLDTFAHRVMVAARPPWHVGDFTPCEVDDVTGLRVAAWLQDAGLQVSLATAQGAIAETADRNKYHPVRDYLDGLAWDGVPRIDTWLIDYFGAEDTPLNRAVAAKFLLSMVARVRRPGCKVDTVLILEGSQGRMKSSAFAALAGAWFIDHMPDLHDKAALEQLQGKWLVEFAELDKLHKAEAARVKAFISTATDRFRPAYGHYARDYPRQCVFVGTVNPGAVGYLQDETGNRRFWPVACPRRADVMALRAARDQIWAEASARHAAGEAWWIETSDLEDMQAEAAAERMAGDVWADRIADYLADKPSVTTAEVLSHALAKPTERWTHADMTRVGRVMTMLGWRCRQVRCDGGRRERRYFPGGMTA